MTLHILTFQAVRIEHMTAVELSTSIKKKGPLFDEALAASMFLTGNFEELNAAPRFKRLRCEVSEGNLQSLRWMR